MRQTYTPIWNSSRFFLITTGIIFLVTAAGLLTGCSTAALGRKPADNGLKDCYIISDELDGAKTTDKVSEILSGDTP